MCYTYEIRIIVREAPDHTGNEPTPDIHIEGSGQDLENTKW